MAFDREGLERFVGSGDKSPPPVFVGRETILSGIERRSALAWKGPGAPDQGEPGLTHIIQGAPGAGKSAVLDELRGRALRGRGAAPAPVPQVLYLETGEIIGPQDILLPLAEMVMRAPDLVAGIRQQVRGIVKGAVPRRLQGAADELVGRAPDPRMRSWAEFRRWLDGWTGGGGLAGPVIIAIDEAQRFERTAEDPVAKVLQTVHGGRTRLPVTLVLAGLGSTRDRASDMHLTRGTEIHGIGGLEDGDVEVLLPAFCRHFGMDPDGCGDRLRDLARPCEGWPRHLHFAMQALGREALRTDGDLRRVDWWEVAAQAGASRQRHYLERRSAGMRESRFLVAKVMRDLRRGADVVDVIASIEDSIEDRPGYRLPTGMGVNGFLDHLVERGALQERLDGTFHSPIPSFRAHLAGDGRGPNDPGGEPVGTLTPPQSTPSGGDDGPGM